MEELNEGRVLVDFWAPWCQPCKMQKPQMVQFEALETDVKVIMVNIDEDIETPQKFGVRSIPTILYLENGEEKRRSIGYTGLDKLKEMANIG